MEDKDFLDLVDLVSGVIKVVYFQECIVSAKKITAKKLLEKEIDWTEESP